MSQTWLILPRNHGFPVSFSIGWSPDTLLCLKSSMAWKMPSSKSSPYLKHAAQGLEEEKKQILYLLGPVGGGKSSLAERLKSLMQRVPIYVLSANGERSPVNDHPLCLFNPQEDAQILDKEYGIPASLSRHHHVAVGGETPA